MPRVVDINDLVGEDIAFLYGDPPVEYRLPGDIDVESVFGFLAAFAALNTPAEGADAAEEMQRRFEVITGQLLALFQIRAPGLEKWPFGMRGTGQVLKVVLAELGMSVSETDPPAPSLNRQTRRATAKKTPA